MYTKYKIRQHKFFTQGPFNKSALELRDPRSEIHYM